MSAVNGERPAAIHISGLIKSYGDFRALHGIDLDIKSGEVFGFLGPNGAGKTTTIRCLLDMIRPTSGTLRVLGLEPRTDAVAIRRRVGYLPGELNLDDNMTARQLLRLFDSFRGHIADWKYTFWLAERLELNLDVPVKNFSKGNKQKVGVVQAFMHQPELLLLDEPTSGLDPLMQQKVLRLVREAHGRGATVFFSSHILSEVEAVCDRVGIVRKGRLVEVTDTQRLTSQRWRWVTVTFRVAEGAHGLEAVPGVKSLTTNESGAVRLRVEGSVDPLLKALAKLSVDDVQIERPSLEEIFLSYYEGEGSP